MLISKGFGGHTVRAYLDYKKALDGKIDYITFLRDPLKRYLSHYNYQKSVMNIDWSFDDFLAEERFSNFMTKRIAGVYDIEKAKEVLENYFSFVGLTEFFDQSLLIMKDRLFDEGFNLFYQKKNVATLYLTENFSEEHIRKMNENNQLDLELYAFATDKLYKKYIEEYPHDLCKDLEEFQKNKGAFSCTTNIVHRLLSRVYDLFFSSIEGKIHRKHHRY